MSPLSTAALGSVCLWVIMGVNPPPFGKQARVIVGASGDTVSRRNGGCELPIGPFKRKSWMLGLYSRARLMDMRICGVFECLGEDENKWHSGEN